MKWRIIRRELHNAAMNMGIDHALSLGVGEKIPPTIRFYSWNPTAVSIGYFQKLHEKVNTEKCSDYGIDYIRRMSGGSSCFHNNISYSIVAPVYVFSRFLKESFREINQSVVNALKEIGIETSIKLDDILVDGKVISRSSATIKNDAIIYQGNIFFEMDIKKVAQLLHSREEKIRDTLTSVSEHSKATEKEVLTALEKSFSADKDWEYGTFSKEELIKAQELSLTYSSRKWNFMR
jgi:lipoate---protein ligase